MEQEPRRKVPNTTPKVRKLNLSSVVRQTENMSDPEVTIAYGSLQAFTSVLGTPVFDKACQDNPNLTHTRPGNLSLGDLEDEPGVLVGTPCLTKDETTTKMRWDVKNNQVIIDMMAAMKLMHFEVPAESTAHIPVTYMSVPGHGPSVLFHFNKATYEPIIRTGPRKPKEETDKK